MAVFGLLVDGDSDLFPNGFGFEHDPRDELTHQGVVQNSVGRGPGDGTDGVDRHVAPKFVPNVFLDLRRHAGVEASLLQQCVQGLHARRGLARRLAHDQAITKVMTNHPRRIHRATGMDHAADDVRGRQGACNRPLRVHGVQRAVRYRATEPLQKPPRHAVHGGQHHGVGADQWSKLLCD